MSKLSEGMEAHKKKLQKQAEERTARAASDKKAAKEFADAFTVSLRDTVAPVFQEFKTNLGHPCEIINGVNPHRVFKAITLIDRGVLTPIGNVEKTLRANVDIGHDKNIRFFEIHRLSDTVGIRHRAVRGHDTTAKTIKLTDLTRERLDVELLDFYKAAFPV